MEEDAVRKKVDKIADEIAKSVGGVSPEEMQSIKKRAFDMIMGKGSEDQKKLDEMREVGLAMVMPVIRKAFRAMGVAAGLSASQKANLEVTIEGLSKNKNHTCYEVNFVNKITGEPSVVTVGLDECDRSHNLGDMLENLRPIMDDPAMGLLKNQISVLIHIGLKLYAEWASAHVEVIRHIFSLPDSDKCEGLLSFEVDMKDTTLFLKGCPGFRVGIFLDLLEKKKQAA